jgi:hypothetical protein
MSESKKYLPVNWIDGMKINKNHFITERNAQLQHAILSTGTHISHINYGLMPLVVREHNPFKIFVSMDNMQQVQVRLVNCRAVTPGGALISIEDGAYEENDVKTMVPELMTDLESLRNKSARAYVVLTVNPYDRLPVGMADMNELPPRIPYAAPTYSLSILPESELVGQRLGLYQLTISRILVTDSRVTIDEDYLPPCTAVSSHPELQDIYYALEEFMGQIELFCLQINQKIYQKNQHNSLSDIFEKVCNNIIQYQNNYFAHFKWIAMNEPPCFMMAHVASIARIFKNTIDVYVNAGKEELMNYIAEWCDISQASIETVVTELSNHRYQHEDIHATIVKTQAFTKLISSLFFKLSRLDYIGKKKEANIFVKEEIVNKEKTAENTNRRRTSFLAD